jgi:hypothetical protein
MDIESARYAPETDEKNEVNYQDLQWQKRQVEKIMLKIGGSFGGYTTYCFTFDTDGAELSQHSVGGILKSSKKRTRYERQPPLENDLRQYIPIIGIATTPTLGYVMASNGV